MIGWNLLGGIEGVHVIGWLVTLIGIGSAALVAGKGWQKSSEAAILGQDRRRVLDDENARRILRDAIWEGLGSAIVFIPPIIEQMKEGRFLLPEQLLHLDEGRRSYDRNKDNMVHWKNQNDKERVQLWFREAAVWRSLLDQYVVPRPEAEVRPVYSELRQGHLRALEVALAEARGIYEELDLPRVNPGEVGYEKWAPKRPSGP